MSREVKRCVRCLQEKHMDLFRRDGMGRYRLCRDCYAKIDATRIAARKPATRENAAILYEVIGIDGEGKRVTLPYGAGVTREGVDQYFRHVLSKRGVEAVQIYVTHGGYVAKGQRELLETVYRKARNAA